MENEDQNISATFVLQFKIKKNFIKVKTSKLVDKTKKILKQELVQ